MSQSQQKLMSKNTKTKKIDTNKSFLSEMNPKLKVSSQHCGRVKDGVNRFEIEEGKMDWTFNCTWGRCPLLELEAKQEVQYLNVIEVEDTCA